MMHDMNGMGGMGWWHDLFWLLAGAGFVLLILALIKYLMNK